MANFVVVLTPSETTVDLKRQWTLYVDGSTNEKGCGAGILLQSPEGTWFEYALRFNFKTSNNKAEYEALLVGCRIAQSMGVACLLILIDSQRIVNHITEELQAKDSKMAKYLEKARVNLDKFKDFVIRQILRSENSNADALTKLASPYETEFPVPSPKRY